MNIALYGLLGLGAALFVSTGYAYVERERRIAATERAETAEAVAASKERANQALQTEARAARRRAADFERIRRDVVDSPDSRACAASPAVGAALRGLRARHGAAGGAGGADGATTPPRPANRPHGP